MQNPTLDERDAECRLWVESSLSMSDRIVAKFQSRQNKSIALHIISVSCASLGGAYGLVELVLDLDYILELEWICGKMDTHYESFRVIKIIPWRYGILVSN